MPTTNTALLRFVALVHLLQESGVTAVQAKDDADTVIVRTALDIAAKGESVTVIAHDTDILVLQAGHG